MDKNELFRYKMPQKMYSKRPWSDVESSNIKRMSYDASNAHLYVQFHKTIKDADPNNILVYVYWDVSEQELGKCGLRYDKKSQKLIKKDGESLGKRFNTVIKASKKYVRVEFN
jgi:uncharacterized protein (DUF2252 family)